MKLGKRGAGTETNLYFLFGLVLTVIVCAILVIHAYSVARNTLFFKQHTARDIAMLMNTIYASPGELVYNYPSENKGLSNYDIIIVANNVTVKESIIDQGQKYVFANDSKIALQGYEGKSDFLRFNKDTSKITIGQTTSPTPTPAGTGGPTGGITPTGTYADVGLVVPGGTVTQEFGLPGYAPIHNSVWLHCNGNPYHHGVDIDSVDEGTEIKAYVSGIVVDFLTTGVPNGGDTRGAFVSIKADDGSIYRYIHLRSGSLNSAIQIGARIEAGTKVGEMGNTGAVGTVSYYHLHFDRNINNGARDCDSYVDPFTGKTLSQVISEWP